MEKILILNGGHSYNKSQPVVHVEEEEPPMLPPGQVGSIETIDPIIPIPKGTEEPPLLPNIQ